jgi:O-antigen ligase
MSTASYFALFALVAMMLLYSVEDQWSFAPLGMSVAAAIAAVGEFVAGYWPFAAAALGFAIVALRRWYKRREDADI